MRTVISLFVVGGVLLAAGMSSADIVLLEDYSGGGAFDFAYDQNPSDAGVNGTNRAYDAGSYLAVEWATLWEGGVSSGSAQDLDAYDTYTFDIKVESGQPVESGSEYYLQFNMQSATGYAYWEGFISQTLIPADSTWYRVEFPFASLGANSGGGGSDPTDFATVEGVTLGMRYDPDATSYGYKVVSIDNVLASDAGVSSVTVTAIPEPATLALFGLGLLAFSAWRKHYR